MKPRSSNPDKAGIFVPAPIVYVSVSDVSPSYERYPKKTSVSLGAIQILFGVLCIVCYSVSLAVAISNRVFDLLLGHGFTCGALFIATGSIGVAAGWKKTKCQIVAYMVMCILSTVFAFFLLILGLFSAFSTYHYHRYYLQESVQISMPEKTVIAMESCLAIWAVIEAVLFIWGSVLCCKSGACCCSRSYQPLMSSLDFGHHLDMELQKPRQNQPSSEQRMNT